MTVRIYLDDALVQDEVLPAPDGELRWTAPVACRFVRRERTSTWSENLYFETVEPE